MEKNIEQGLEIARGFGLDKVLLTINDDNIVSIKLCEINDCILMDKITADNKDERHTYYEKILDLFVNDSHMIGYNVE